MHAVTRVELFEAVKTAFEPSASPTPTATLPKDLVAAAIASGARPAVVAELEALQDDLQIRRMRELWEHFPNMPVDSTSAAR